MALPAFSVRDDYVPGDLLAGRYELASLLGVGGMGVVWRAHDLVLNLDVALKLVLLRTPDAIGRALTEARAAARLSHPAVARVLDYGSSERGDPFVVSEFLEGETLDELVGREGRVPAVQAVRLLLPILEALEVAHLSGIVHRDVKPSNIFLARRGSHGVAPKLLDFGIARWKDNRVKNTTTGNIVGTPCYMSPEQARGSTEVGPAADLWSFCATLYETITGVPPFDGDNYNAVLWSIQNREPLPLTAHHVGDEDLGEIARRGLTRELDGRFGSARALSGELAGWLISRGVGTDICGRSLHELAEDSVPGLATSRYPPSGGSHARAGARPGFGLRSRSALALGVAAALLLAGAVSWFSRGEPQAATQAATKMSPPAASGSPPASREPRASFAALEVGPNSEATTAAKAPASQAQEPPAELERAAARVGRAPPAESGREERRGPAGRPPSPPAEAEPTATPESSVDGVSGAESELAERRARASRRPANALGYDFGF